MNKNNKTIDNEKDLDKHLTDVVSAEYGSSLEEQKAKTVKKMKVSDLDSLTPEQEAKIPAYVDKCINQAVNCEPCDREKVERLVDECYRERGLTPPKEKIWCKSPKDAALKQFDYAKEHGFHQTSYQIPEISGGFELSWLGFYGFLTEPESEGGLNLEWDGDLSPHLEMARHAGWWMPYDDVVFLCERKSVLKRDNEGRLHCENGPAIGWEDWGLYFWHGTNVPAEWIEDTKNVDPRLVFTHEDAEKRRCLAEIIGWTTVLELLDTTTIDEDPDPEVGKLLETTLPESDTPDRFLVVKCGTGRTFAMPVPPDVKTAAEAQVWMLGFDAGDIDFGLLKPEVRT